VQVDSIKPTLKAPGSKRLILKYDQLVSNVGFNFNLRRFIMDDIPTNHQLIIWYGAQWFTAGPYTRSLVLLNLCRLFPAATESILCRC